LDAVLEYQPMVGFGANDVALFHVSPLLNAGVTVADEILVALYAVVHDAEDAGKAGAVVCRALFGEHFVGVHIDGGMDRSTKAAGQVDASVAVKRGIDCWINSKALIESARVFVDIHVI
jgi:hypothetical protein